MVGVGSYIPFPTRQCSTALYQRPNGNACNACAIELGVSASGKLNGMGRDVVQVTSKTSGEAHNRIDIIEVLHASAKPHSDLGPASTFAICTGGCIQCTSSSMYSVRHHFRVLGAHANPPGGIVVLVVLPHA